MPAPTALLQPNPAPETVPAPAPEQQDELLVDMQDSSVAEPSAVAPSTATEDTDMAIDEEGRPRFAPGNDVVCGHSRVDAEEEELLLTASCTVSRIPSVAPRQERSPSHQTACLR
jgi:hypothetical protein